VIPAAAALLAVVVAQAAAPAPAPAAPATELDVTLDPDARRIRGHARLRVVNDRATPLTGLGFWLYPNALAKRSPALTDVSFHWLYPGGFSPAAIDVSNVAVDGQPARDVQMSEIEGGLKPGGKTMLTLSLPAPLPPGGAVTVDLDFDTRIPARYGAFGCDGARCRLMGGFYPVPARDGGPGNARNPDEPQLARAGRTRMTLRLPAGFALVADGWIIGRGNAEPVTVDSDDTLYPTIVTDRVLRPATARQGEHVVHYLHRRPRPPGSDDRPLPYVREDIAALVLDTARRALAFADAVLPPGSPARALPVTLVEAPLRHELVQEHGDVILVSDQIFGIFPFNRLRKYHHLQIARAIFTVVADAAVRAHEAPADRARAAGVLAAHLTELFARARFDRVEYAPDLLRPFDFVPAVDQMLYAPLLASSQSYFGDVDDRDAVRDGLRAWVAVGPTPAFVYSKLADVLGPERFAAAARAMLRDATPLRPAAARAYGADLGWFWQQWLSWYRGVSAPAVNYRVQSVTETPTPAGSHVSIDVRREGQAVREPVEVLVEDRDGGARTLRWDDDAAAHRFDVDLPARLRAVELDPRRRLAEAPVGSLRWSDDPRMDNRTPPRWRLIYLGLGTVLDISQLTANVAVGVLAKPQHDLRRHVIASVFHTETSQIGAGATGGLNFGRQADRNNLVSTVLAGVTGARLDPSFGERLGEAPQPGWRATGRLGFNHDTRDYAFDPWTAVGLSAAVGYSLTALDGGSRLSQGSTGVEALRLFELAPGHVLAGAVEGAATFGDIRLASQLTGAGGPLGLRGFSTDELLARARLIGRLQLRNDYFTGLDWNLLHFTTVRAIAGTLFADVAAITTCDDYQFSRERIFADAGYSFRVLHDAFGVHHQLLSIDVAVPINRHAPYATCLGAPYVEVPRPSVLVRVSFFPSF
jgi:hypothetical protein